MVQLQGGTMAVPRAASTCTIPDLKLAMARFVPGSFLMGTEAEPDHQVPGDDGDGAGQGEIPVGWVMLTQPFWLGRTARLRLDAWTPRGVLSGGRPILPPGPPPKQANEVVQFWR
jgi:hypothetical protein